MDLSSWSRGVFGLPSAGQPGEETELVDRTPLHKEVEKIVQTREQLLEELNKAYAKDEVNVTECESLIGQVECVQREFNLLEAEIDTKKKYLASLISKTENFVEEQRRWMTLESPAASGTMTLSYGKEMSTTLSLLRDVERETGKKATWSSTSIADHISAHDQSVSRPERIVWLRSRLATERSKVSKGKQREGEETVVTRLEKHLDWLTREEADKETWKNTAESRRRHLGLTE
jgi:hypothetical protein